LRKWRLTVFVYRPDMTPEQIQLHEAGHAAACLSLGIPVRFVSVIPGRGFGGWVTVDRPVDPDPEYLIKQATDIMCAWIEGCNSMDEIPDWPLDSRPVTSTDEQDLARIASELEWDEYDYGRLKLKAFKLMETDTYRLIFDTIVGVTDIRPQLDRYHVEAITKAVVKHLKSEDDDDD
jgi:hypothetical protein